MDDYIINWKIVSSQFDVVFRPMFRLIIRYISYIFILRLPAYTKVTIRLFSDLGAQADITPFIAGTDQPCQEIIKLFIHVIKHLKVFSGKCLPNFAYAWVHNYNWKYKFQTLNTSTRPCRKRMTKTGIGLSIYRIGNGSTIIKTLLIMMDSPHTLQCIWPLFIICIQFSII